MFRKVKKRHSSSSSQSSEISTKSKVRTTNNKLVIFIFKGKSKLVPPKKSLSLYILAPVCRLQLGRTFQIQYCCQSWHRLYQELRFVAVLWYCSNDLTLFGWLIDTLPWFPTAGNSSTETCAEFRVKYVGAIEKLHFDMSKTLQEPLDLINYIDAAQVNDRISSKTTRLLYLVDVTNTIQYIPYHRDGGAVNDCIYCHWMQYCISGSFCVNSNGALCVVYNSKMESCHLCLEMRRWS